MSQADYKSVYVSPAKENMAGCAELQYATARALAHHSGKLDEALASIYAYHIQRLDELQLAHPEFFDAQEVAWRECGRELLLRAITS
jgi:hypothetical protein